MPDAGVTLPLPAREGGHAHIPTLVLTGPNGFMTEEAICVTGITGITGFWAKLPLVEKKKIMPIVPHHYTYATLINPVILVIPVTDGDLCVINLLGPVIT